MNDFSNRFDDGRQEVRRVMNPFDNCDCYDGVYALI
jgi:hypothetical protein